MPKRIVLEKLMADVCLKSRFPVAPPAGPLVSDPAALTEFPCKMSVDGGSVVAIASNVNGVEVVQRGGDALTSQR